MTLSVAILALTQTASPRGSAAPVGAVHRIADYIAANEAGAVVDHIHGIYSGDPVIQSDGKNLQIANLEGTNKIIDSIRSANPKNE